MDDARPWPRRALDLAIENPLTKVSSLIMAVFAWLYVQGGQVTEAKVRATVEWKLPAELASAEPLPQTIAVGVKGSRSATRRAQRGDVVLTGDLSNLKDGEHEIESASFEQRGMAPGVTITGFVPPSVRVVLDREIERRVRVKAVTIGDPADGFLVEKTVVEPTVVQVRGPGVVLSDLFEVLTRPIDVSRLSSDREEPVELDLPFSVSQVSGTEIRVRVDVEPVVEKHPIDGVPVVVRNAAYRPSVALIDIVLQGPAAAMREIEPHEVAAIVYLPDEAKSQRFEVGYGPKEGPRIEIVYPDMGKVRVVSVKPSIVAVTRQ